MNASETVSADVAVPEGGRVSTYLLWSLGVGVAFFTIYPTLNWVTSLRPDRMQLYFAAELRIPFVPEWVWVYVSLYALFLMPLFFVPASRMPGLGRQLIMGTAVSGACFFLLPAELGFVREIPSHAPYRELFTSMFGIDHPHNLVPSLHVIYSAAIALACADFARPPARVLFQAWLALIAVSTLLIHQHHLLDLVVAFAIVGLLRRHDRPTCAGFAHRTRSFAPTRHQ